MKKNKLMMTIHLNHRELMLLIHRKQIKNTYIRIDDNKRIIVSTNHKTTVESIIELVIKNKDKILKQIEKSEELELPDNKILVLGHIYDLRLIHSRGFAYKIENRSIILYTDQDLKMALETFYRQYAQEVFSDVLKKAFRFFEENFDLKYPAFEIRKMKNRYGTCYYTRNKICLNLYLIKHDLEIINFVINHELCHFIHHNHSKDFYHLLEQVVKNHIELRRKLFNL